jgi:hypothetical protein
VLLQATRTVPIVFTQTPDPVAAGFVASLARPGSNATAFTTSEYGISGKWLELLKEIAPGVTRAAVLRDPSIPAGIGQLASIQSAYPVPAKADIAQKRRDVRFSPNPDIGLISDWRGLCTIFTRRLV